MNPFILLPITLAIIALAPAAAAQPRPGQGAEITIADNLRVSAPPRWRLSNQTRDSVQYYVPLAANRPRTEDRPQTQTPRSGDAEVKPLYLALYEAGLVVTTERRFTSRCMKPGWWSRPSGGAITPRRCAGLRRSHRSSRRP